MLMLVPSGSKSSGTSPMAGAFPVTGLSSGSPSSGSSSEIRLELDLNYWALGYAAADVRDHGVYVGPFNLQIEIDKFYQERDLVDAWVEFHA